MSELTTNGSHYDLNLPEIAPAFPVDSKATRLLAEQSVRDNLQTVNDAISTKFKMLEGDGGMIVHELFRGVTVDGQCIAVAEMLNPIFDMPQGADKLNIRDYKKAFGNTFVGYIYDLGNLVDDPNFADRLDDHSLVYDQLQREPGRAIVRAQKPSDYQTVGKDVEIKIPTSENYDYGLAPEYCGRDVLSFADAAFGERRRNLHASIVGSLIHKAIEYQKTARTDTVIPKAVYDEMRLALIQRAGEIPKDMHWLNKAYAIHDPAKANAVAYAGYNAAQAGKSSSEQQQAELDAAKEYDQSPLGRPEDWQNR